MVKLSKLAQNCREMVSRSARTAVRRVLSRAQVHPVTQDERNEAAATEQVAVFGKSKAESGTEVAYSGVAQLTEHAIVTYV